MTAVEWLHEKLATSQLEDMQTNINLWFLQAKQIEKEQGYSEEDLKDAFQSGFTNGFNINSVTFDEWFKQFKTKQQ
jgi:hypothetical protein